MRGLYALEGGLAGAAAITIIHEAVKKVVPTAPRMDLLGMEAISKGLRSMHKKVPNDRKLYAMSMAGDLISNSLFYAIAGIGDKKNAVWKGAGLGLAAGLGAVMLPGRLGLSESPSSRTMETKIMTVSLYVLGGVVAALTMKLLDRKRKKEHHDWQQRLVTSSMA